MRDTQKWYDEGRKGPAPWADGHNDYSFRVIQSNMTAKDKKYIKDKHKVFDKSVRRQKKTREEWQKKNPILAKKEQDLRDRMASNLKQKKNYQLID